VRFIMVSQNTRQPTTHCTASRLMSRSAVRSFDCSTWQPDLSTLWYISIFQRKLYQSSIWIAEAKSGTGTLVTSFQWIGSRPFGVPRSRASITVRVRAG